MEFSGQQEEALAAVRKWIESDYKRGQVFKLFGYAGTGKTTIARAVQSMTMTAFAAFTGKAASVLQEKGCYNASTIHSLIYYPSTKSKDKLDQLFITLQSEAEKAGLPADPDDLDKYVGDPPKALTKLAAQIREEEDHLSQPGFIKKEFITLESDDEAPDWDYDDDSGRMINTNALVPQLIIIDECSMVSDKLAEDLLSFNIPVLALGDPAQLPPVKGSGYFNKGKPQYMLTEIHRQAEGNPIIEMATRVRQGQETPQGEYGESRITGFGKLTDDEILGHDQLIVGRNNTRHTCNKWVREKLGYDVASIPQVGEKLVCLRNNHQLGLLNGTLWEVVRCTLHGESPWDPKSRLDLRIRSWGSELPGFIDIVAFSDCFYDLGAKRDWFDRNAAMEFDYGYALTCHKAQGSQWDSVLIRDESEAFRADAQKWLYTAITRAAERVTVVR